MQVARRFASAAAAVLFLTMASCSADEKEPAASTSELGGDDGGKLTDEDLYGPDLTAAEVMDQVAEIAATSDAPGAIVLVRRGDDVLVRAFGRADVQRERAMREDDRMRVGSVTKPMVATAVLELVEAGRLALDDPVEKWLPDLLPDGDRITLAMLLGHQSGLFNFTDARGVDLLAERTPEELVALSTAHPLDFAPGSASAYSNTNFVVLGLVVEKATGKPLERVLDELVFDPLGMRSTAAQVTYAGPRAVHGYEGRKDTGLKRMSVTWGAGMVVSTAEDLDRFLQAVLDGEVVEGELLMKMTTTHPIDEVVRGSRYGLGIGEVDFRCGVAFGHTGEVPGFRSSAFRTEDGQRAAVVLINSSTAPMDALADAALCG